MIAPCRSYLAIRQHLLEDVEPAREIGIRDRQRRREAQHSLAGGADEHAALPARVHDRRRGPVELDPEQEAASARRWEDRPDELLLAADARQQLVADRVYDRRAGGARDGIPAERRAVVAGLEAGRGSFADEQRA